VFLQNTMFQYFQHPEAQKKCKINNNWRKNWQKMQAHKHKPRPMLQNRIVVWHGSFHDFDENHVYIQIIFHGDYTPDYLAGGLPCLSSALSCQYRKKLSCILSLNSDQWIYWLHKIVGKVTRHIKVIGFFMHHSSNRNIQKTT